MNERHRGILYAALAASAFGAAAPAVAYFGREVGPLSTAALLYLGSLSFAVLPDREKGTPIQRSDAPRVLVVGMLGAAIAPAALAWGLQHAGATSAALMLNLEAVFTVALARLLYHEPVGKRMLVALAFILAAGMLLPFRTDERDLRAGAGLGLVALATLAWAADNTLARPLARRRATSVVVWKSIVGIALSGVLALALHDPLPDKGQAAGLFVCGVVGYGSSLKLYVLAQRELGAARTGSVFGFAPLVGAAIAFALGDRKGAAIVGISAMLVAIGLVLLATERKPEAS